MWVPLKKIEMYGRVMALWSFFRGASATWQAISSVTMGPRPNPFPQDDIPEHLLECPNVVRRSRGKNDGNCQQLFSWCWPVLTGATRHHMSPSSFHSSPAILDDSCPFFAPRGQLMWHRGCCNGPMKVKNCNPWKEGDAISGHGKIVHFIRHAEARYWDQGKNHRADPQKWKNCH